MAAIATAAVTAIDRVAGVARRAGARARQRIAQRRLARIVKATRESFQVQDYAKRRKSALKRKPLSVVEDC